MLSFQPWRSPRKHNRLLPFSLAAHRSAAAVEPRVRPQRHSGPFLLEGCEIFRIINAKGPVKDNGNADSSSSQIAVTTSLHFAFAICGQVIDRLLFQISPYGQAMREMGDFFLPYAQSTGPNHDMFQHQRYRCGVVNVRIDVVNQICFLRNSESPLMLPYRSDRPPPE